MLAKSKQTTSGLGRSIINDRKKKDKNVSDRYTTEKSRDPGWVKLQSKTQEGALDEFLHTAQLAETDFTAEKLNVKVVAKDQQNPYLLKPEEEAKVQTKHTHNAERLRVPRRPAWDERTTPAELERLEKEAFLQWRRGLAELQEVQDLLLTPFERNLEVWRQLWRVIERSDLVVQIVDARNPLFFRCEDLERYVQEVDPRKKNFLLVNKADMMTSFQRSVWADYFQANGIHYTFFSASLAREANEDVDSAASSEDEPKVELTHDELEDESIRIITVDELEQRFLAEAPSLPQDEDPPRKLQIGLVGYPNVGKSSTINALIGAKKVSVSATPGKTKHFQTIHLSPSVILCDCPGLVFPNFATTNADLVCNGVLPIDQMREHTGPVALVSQRIPKDFLQATYGFTIHTRSLEEGGTGIPTAEEVLAAYARARGFYTQGQGNPDTSRASRYVLKDYVSGKLLHVHPPPNGGDGADFNLEHYDMQLAKKRASREPNPSYANASKSTRLDRDYFHTGDANSAAIMKLPFSHHGNDDGGKATLADGKLTSGRKARLLAALSTGGNPEELRGVGGGKKHFKMNKRVR